MGQYSELIGSFSRTGNFPLENNYIFESEAALKEFYVFQKIMQPFIKDCLK